MSLIHTLDSEFITESLECLADELGFIVVDNLLGYTKAVEHVMLDELEHV